MKLMTRSSMNQTLRVLKSVCKIYAPNFRNAAIEATFQYLNDLLEESNIRYKEAAKIG
jgi:hypothetical protein